MSLIAQQLLTVQKMTKAQAGEITLEEFRLKLKPSCAIFITSNPHETHSKISNNLKLRFRPITIAVPDIQMILHLNLRALGFPESEKIVLKLTRFYEILWDRLSPQCYYEFGLRNLLVIVEEAALKYDSSKESSILIIAETLALFHRPKLSGNDLEVFNDLLELMFGQLNVDQEESNQTLSDICKKRNIVCSPYIVRKTMEIQSLLEKAVPTIVLGEPDSGKTVCISLVQELLLEKARKEVRIPQERKYKQFINPHTSFRIRISSDLHASSTQKPLNHPNCSVYWIRSLQNGRMALSHKLSGNSTGKSTFKSISFSMDQWTRCGWTNSTR